MPTATLDNTGTEVQPSGPDAVQLPEDTESLYIQGLREAAALHGSVPSPAPEAVVDEPEATDESGDEGDQSDALLIPPMDVPSDDVTDTVDESEETADESADEALEDEEQAATVEAWASVLVDAPQRLSEVPLRYHSSLLAAALKTQAQRVAAQLVDHANNTVAAIRNNEVPVAYQQGYQRGVQEAADAYVAQAEFEELTSLSKDNPEAFAALATSDDPDDRAKFARFVQLRDQASRPQAPAQAPGADMLADFVRVEQVTPQEWEALRQRSAGEQQAGRSGYVPGYAGVSWLKSELQALRAKGTQPVRTDAQTKAAAARRSVAAKQRLSLPKPDVGAAKGPEVREVQLPKDTTDLLRLAAKDFGKTAATANR